jgi:DNA processing protein
MADDTSTSTCRALTLHLAAPTSIDLKRLRQAFDQDPQGDLRKTPRLSAGLRERLQAANHADLVRREVAHCRQQELELITWWHGNRYPEGLSDLPDPPLILYRRGRGAWPPLHPVTVVGARRSTPAGRSFARRLGRAVAQRGATVASGLALGIDQAAHEGGLDGRGPGVAVLACGVDRIYPPGATSLAHRLQESGHLLSEMPLGTPPLRAHFPRRTRILAALSAATLVVEADLRSGSLITAHHALDLGRSVYAVPGSIHQDTARGTNRLIQDGAHPLLGVEELDLLLPGTSSQSDREPLWELLAAPATLAGLCQKTGSSSDELLVQLMDWEAQGKVKRLGTGLYLRT